MKATLEFDLNDFDDKLAHLRCVKATDMALLIWQIRMNLRRNAENMLAQHPKFKDSPDAYEGMEIVFKALEEIFEDEHVNIDELIV